MTYEETGKRIKARRKELNISAATLAEKLGLSKATIHRYENGDIKNIKMPVLESMADVLKVNPLWLIGKTDNKDSCTVYDLHAEIEKSILSLKTCDTVYYKDEIVPKHVRHRLIATLEVVRSAFDA